MVGRIGVDMQPQGAFIVLESTSLVSEKVIEALVSRLEAANFDVLELNFPRKSSQASYFTRQLSSGAYGPQNEVGPYTEAMFEALDFFDAATDIRNQLLQGGIVIAQHYTSSTMALHGKKFVHDEERRGFYIWLDNMVSIMLKVPRPTQTFVLNDTTAEQNVVATYAELGQLFPQDFKLLDLVRSGQPVSEESTIEILWEAMSPLLPPPLAARRPSVNPSAKFSGSFAETPTNYVTPSTLPAELHDEYQNGVTQLLTKHVALRDTVTNYAVENLLLADLPVVQNALNLALPVAVHGDTPLPSAPTPSEISGTYGQQVDSLRLVSVSPRNELELLRTALYPQSHLSIDELAEEISTWSYAKKSSTYLEALQSGASRSAILQEVYYSWDVLNSFLGLAALRESGLYTQLNNQLLTPRYGYEVPKIIEDAGASDLFEDCFDLSLQLHSQLVAAGYEQEAQYVTLLGHKVRWSFQQSGTQAINLLSAISAGHLSVLAPLSKQLELKLRQTHPLLLEQLRPSID